MEGPQEEAAGSPLRASEADSGSMLKINSHKYPSFGWPALGVRVEIEDTETADWRLSKRIDNDAKSEKRGALSVQGGANQRRSPMEPYQWLALCSSNEPDTGKRSISTTATLVIRKLFSRLYPSRDTSSVELNQLILPNLCQNHFDSSTSFRALYLRLHLLSHPLTPLDAAHSDECLRPFQSHSFGQSLVRWLEEYLLQCIPYLEVV